MSKEGKREQILTALNNLLPGKRFHEITLDEVARAAQVGKGTIYLYFHDKDALFYELICYRIGCLRQELMSLNNCTIEELPGKVMAMVEKFIREHHTGFGAVSDLAAHVARLTPEQHEQLKNESGLLVDALAGVMRNAESSWSEAEARSYAQILLWMIDGYSRSRSSFGGVNGVPDTEFLTTFFRRGAKLG